MIPEVRTKPATAIAMSVAALVSLVIAAFAGSRLEDLLGSAGLSTAVLGVWCVLGFGAAIAAIVDAYVKPEGERLSLAATVAATLFAVLGLAVVSGVVAGAADLGSGDELEQELRRSAR
jgi:predicted exporter